MLEQGEEEDMGKRREREEEGRKGREYCIHLLQGVLPKMSTPRMSTPKMSTPKILHMGHSMSNQHKKIPDPLGFGQNLVLT